MNATASSATSGSVICGFACMISLHDHLLGGEIDRGGSGHPPDVYRYFPSADALMTAAAIASVDDFLDRLTNQVSGLADPVEAMTEAVVFTLTDVRRTPHLGILLSSSYSNVHPESITSDEAQAFGMTMIRRFDVDWAAHGYDEPALRELVEYVLRTMQSFFLSPGSPTRSDEELRRYLHRWMGTAISAQTTAHTTKP